MAWSIDVGPRNSYGPLPSYGERRLAYIPIRADAGFSVGVPHVEEFPKLQIL